VAGVLAVEEPAVAPAVSDTQEVSEGGPAGAATVEALVVPSLVVRTTIGALLFEEWLVRGCSIGGVTAGTATAAKGDASGVLGPLSVAFGAADGTGGAGGCEVSCTTLLFCALCTFFFSTQVVRPSPSSTRNRIPTTFSTSPAPRGVITASPTSRRWLAPAVRCSGEGLLRPNWKRGVLGGT
jgi:hypothetical protein